ncbi:MAG: hypothetical protein OQL20_00405 [Sedimenticola sp.]|nr:hypothetical protein [Sedimenticola sp.]
MMIKLTQVFAILAGLGAISLFSGQAIAAPSGLPQAMVPAYIPASPAQGVARFRPHYRMQQPVRYLPPGYSPRPGNVPPQYRPARRAMAWPLPVSYRPIVRAPRPPAGAYYAPHARPGFYPHPVAMRGYPVRPVAPGFRGNPYAQRPMQWRGQPPVFNGYRGYRPPMPVNYRPPVPRMPVRSAMYAPVYSYPQPRMIGSMPRHQPMPGRLARYQPYFPRPGVPNNYNFRPAQPTGMNVPQTAFQPQPVRRGYPVNYRYRPELRYPVAARQVYPAQMAPGRYPGETAYQRSDAVAWTDAPFTGR